MQAGHCHRMVQASAVMVKAKANKMRYAAATAPIATLPG